MALVTKPAKENKGDAVLRRQIGVQVFACQKPVGAL